MLNLLRKHIDELTAESTIVNSFARTLRWSGMNLASLERGAWFLILAIASLLFSSMLLSLEFAQLRQRNYWVQHTLLVLERSKTLLSLLQDAETSQQSYLLTDEPDYLSPYFEAMQGVYPELRHLQQLTVDNPIQQTRLRRLEPLIRQRLALIDQTIQLNKQGNSVAALAIVRTHRGRNYMEQIRQSLREFEAEEQRLLEQRTAQAETTARALYAGILGTALIPLGLLLVATGVLERDRHLREQVERSLRDREASLQALGDNLPRGAIYQLVRELDGSYHFTYISAGIEEISEVTPEQVLQDQQILFDQMLPEDVPHLLETIEYSAQHLSVYDMQARKLTPSGKLKWVHYRATPRLLEDGRILWDGIEIEITDLKQAEIALLVANQELEVRVAERTAELNERNAQLEDSENRLLLTLDAAKAGTWEWIPQDNMNIWSDQTYRLMGYEPGTVEPSHKAWLARIHPDDRERVVAYSQNLVRDRSTVDLELRLLLPDGTIRWVQEIGKPIYSPEGELLSFAGIKLDITARKRAEATLYEVERRWRSLLENVRLLVVWLDCLGRVEYINPYFLEMTGYRSQDVLGKDWGETVLPEREQKQFRQNLHTYLEQQQASHNRNAIVTASGEEKLIAWNNTVLFDEAGKIIGVIGIGEDVTQQEAIERAKNEFISMVSHELRTPLASIRGALGLLSAGVLKDQPETTQQMLNIASVDTERLVRLVNDILDLERLELGKTNLNKQWHNAADLMQQAIATLQALADQNQITLACEPLTVQVWADRDRVIQTFVNLISNAVKFSLPGTTIFVTAEIINDLSQPFVQFAVRDEGRGIPPEKLETIFGPFQQVDASDSRQKGGTGLGLSICRTIVQQHGGKIWVESRLGEGSTFFFTLPMMTEGT